MSKINFDQYAEQYTKILEKQLGFFAESSYFSAYKIKIIRENILREPKNILEYGCGIGSNLPHLKQLFPNAEIYGYDISAQSLSIAAKNNPGIKLFTSNNNEFNNNFDLVFVAGVLHHIEPSLRDQSVTEIYNFLNSSGEVFIFEHNPYNPITQHLVNTCPFDKDAVLIRPGALKSLLRNNNFSIQKMRYALFIPKFLKKLRFIERYLNLIPLGGQYFIHAKK